MPDAPANPTVAPGPAAPAAIASESSGERDRREAGSLASAVRTVSGFTLLSRFAGLARDIITARVFGADALGSAFRAAYAVPHLFRRLFGEGALSAAFLPEYTLLRRDDPDAAGQLATMVVRMLTLVTGGLTLLIEAGLLIRLIAAPAAPDLALSLRLIMLMLPMMPLVCLTAIYGGMLQAHGKFGPPAAAPIILNLFQVVAAAFFFMGLTGSATATAYWVGGAAVLASVAQVAWSLAALRGSVRWGRAGAAARARGASVLRRFLPAVLGLGTLQLNTMLDTTIAMWPQWVGPTMFGRPVPLDVASNAILSFTQTLYQFPLGVFGIAVATAVFPLLSRSADRPAEFVQHLRRGLRLSLFIGLPASVGLVLVRTDLITVIYGGGADATWGPGAVARSAAVLAGFAPAVWAYSLNHVFTRAFYARGDTTTPMRLALAMVGLNLALNLTLVWPLREAGLAWSTAISAVVQCVVLGWLLSRRLPDRAIDGETWAAFGRVALVAAVMGAALFALGRAWPEPVRWSGHLLRLAVAVVIGAGTYGVGALALRMPEARWLLRRGGGGGGGGGPSAGMSFE